MLVVMYNPNMIHHEELIRICRELEKDKSNIVIYGAHHDNGYAPLYIMNTDGYWNVNKQITKET